MTWLLFIIAALGLSVGGAFFWLNLNSPIQTRIPAFFLPVGIVSAILWLGRVI